MYDCSGTITTQLSILHVFAKVAKWKFHDVTHFVAVIKEMELNSEIYFKIDDIQNEAEYVEDIQVSVCSTGLIHSLFVTLQ